MEKLKLEASYRSDLSKGYAKRIRREGCATGSVFGHGTEPIAIGFNLVNLTTQIKQSKAGITALIDMKVKDAPSNSDGIVIIKGFHRDPLTQKVVDIQFQRVFMKEKMHVNVPVVIVGEAVGAKSGGTLEQQLYQLEVNCLPNNIPASIEVDVSNLGTGDNIKVSDIKVDDNVEILTDSNTIVCIVVAPHVVAAEAETPAPEAAPEASTSSE